jgi:hypothetical protein
MDGLGLRGGVAIVRGEGEGMETPMSGADLPKLNSGLKFG